MYIDSQTYELSIAKVADCFEVDDLIAPTIQTLNRKGYRTSACCSGHNFHKPDYAYIQFGFGEITPETLPQGWYWTEKGQQMEYEYTTDFGETRLAEIQWAMKALYEWSLTLLNVTL